MRNFFGFITLRQSQLKSYYKIKLHQAGYRLIYQVNDNKMVLLVVAVGKRDKNKVYEFAEDRQTPSPSSLSTA